MYAAFESFVDFLWGIPLIAIILITGLILTIRSKFFQFSHLGVILKSVMHKGKGKQESKDSLSPFQALCIAVGGTVGVSNISGVATAIATGGPGALFWIWVAAFLGMIIKTAEISLAVYYRRTQPDGSFRGGPTFYIESFFKEKGWKGWFIPAAVFAMGIYTCHFITLQNYTVAEAVGTAFNIPFIIPGAVLAICVYLIILGGVKKIGEIASYMVPFMCMFYIGCAIIVMVANYDKLIPSIALIFESAFTGHAAAGGFAGATMTMAMRYGFARSVNSNEAGWGTSPMIHAMADTDHPIKQGIFGALEVFIDTIVVCSMSAMVVIVTGVWDSGLQGAALSLAGFESVLGKWSTYIIALSVFVFALTTNAGWFAYYKTLIEHFLTGRGPFWEKVKDKWLLILRLDNPIPGFLVTVYTVYVGATPAQLWTVYDFVTLIPTFVNVIMLFLLSSKFLMLLKDYKARCLGIGKVDENVRLFYEQVGKDTKKDAHIS